MTRDELIETMAQCMHGSAAYSSFWTVVDMRIMATAALAAIEAQGMAIVPVTATKEMQDAIWLASYLQNANSQYSAMIEVGKL